MAFWNVAAAPLTIFPAGSIAEKDYIVQNTGANTVYVSDQQNVTADATSLAIYPGTPFTWSKTDPMYAICTLGAPSTLFAMANGSQVGTSVSNLQSAIQSLITVVSGSAVPQTSYVNAAAANTLYDAAYVNVTGLYVITCASAIVSNVSFYDTNNNFILTATTVSGTITINIPSAIGSIKFWTTSGTNTQIGILKSGINVSPVPAVMYTYTTSQTISLVGAAYCVVVGGGCGGTGNLAGFGSSGGSGGITGGKIALNGSTVLTIGAGSTNGALAGSTTLGAFTATGGNGGTGGTPSGGNGGASNNAGPGFAGSASAAASTIFFSFTQGTTGGGGGAGNITSGGAGGGSGIGTGGTGAGPSAGNGGTGSGFGAGGGGGFFAASGGTVTNGVCYILL